MPPLREVVLLIFFVALIAICLSCCGCGTLCSDRGRISLIDIDFRTPEQIRAGGYEAGAVYGQPVVEQTATERVVPPSIWLAAIKVLTELECRFRFGTFEWDNTDAVD